MVRPLRPATPERSSAYESNRECTRRLHDPLGCGYRAQGPDADEVTPQAPQCSPELIAVERRKQVLQVSRRAPYRRMTCDSVQHLRRSLGATRCFQDGHLCCPSCGKHGHGKSERCSDQGHACNYGDRRIYADKRTAGQKVDQVNDSKCF